MKYFVLICRTIENLEFKLASDRKIQATITGREDNCFWLLAMVPRWSRFTSNFYVLICQNLTGEFMRKIYASWNLFTLTAEADRVLCRLSTGCKKWNAAAIKVLLLFMASLFFGFLVEKYVACQSRKSDFGSYRFRFLPCLMRKRTEKYEAVLALLDSFQELQLEW